MVGFISAGASGFYLPIAVLGGYCYLFKRSSEQVSSLSSLQTNVRSINSIYIYQPKLGALINYVRGAGDTTNGKVRP